MMSKPSQDGKLPDKPKNKQMVSWQEALAEWFAALALGKQSRRIDIITGCSGTGAPMIGLEAQLGYAGARMKVLYRI